MRLYTFVNYYLSSIQQGIQTAHLVSELLAKYYLHGDIIKYKDQQTRLFNWAVMHKTIIVLNGGNSKDIEDIYISLKNDAYSLALPFANFYEDEDSLGGIMTCCGLVVPAELYNAKLCISNNGKYYNDTDVDGVCGYEKNTPKWNIINTIKSRSLAK